MPRTAGHLAEIADSVLRRPGLKTLLYCSQKADLQGAGALIGHVTGYQRVMPGGEDHFRRIYTDGRAWPATINPTHRLFHRHLV